MTDTPPNWPKKGNRAFKPSVSAADQVRLQTFVMPSEGTYIVGFQRAADMVVDGAQADDLNPDNLFFPVAYLYRHHLELMLKALVRLGVRVGALEKCRESIGGHNLHRLWNKAKQVIQQVWPNSPGDDLMAVERVILEFHRFDPTSQAFRYPRDKQGMPHLQDAPGSVNLLNLKATVAAVSSFLDAAYAGIESCDPGPP